MTVVSFFSGRIHVQPLKNIFYPAIFAERETIVNF